MKLRKVALLGAAAGVVLATPAAAQMQHMNMPGMHMPGMKMPAPKKPAPAKKAAAAKKVAGAKKKSTSKSGIKATPSSSSKGATKKRPSDPHARHSMASMPGMDMSPGDKMPAKSKKLTKPKVDAHAGHDMSSMPGMEMPGGHDMSNMPAMNMPGHDMSNMPGMNLPVNTDAETIGTNLPAGDAPAPPVPTADAADQIYGANAMAMGRHHLNHFHGGQKIGQVFFNLAEYQLRKGRDGFEWNAQAWYGGDINRLWLKSEGDGDFHRGVDRAEVQALYSHAVGPYFNVQGGVRYDFKPNPSRVYATVGVEGLAPTFFELEGALFLSNKGELLARAEGYYDQRITQRLILQPRAELNFAAQSTPELGVGSGLSDAELGVRLRYDITRQFAPYLGVQYERRFGNTRRYREAAGDDAGGWSVLTGVRTWF